MPGNQINYVPLPLKIKKNGFLFFQLIRTGNFAVYRQIKNNRIIGYEVFKIRKIKESSFFGKHYPAQEMMPGIECFGLDSWSLGTDMLKALDFFRLKDIEFRTYLRRNS